MISLQCKAHHELRVFVWYLLNSRNSLASSQTSKVLIVGSSSKRTAREKRTVRAMIRIYCVRRHHPDHAPCNECQQLLEYAERKIDRCPLIKDKPTCAKCSIHCYEKSKREQIKSVMRFSGPRMIYHHPILSVRHLADGHKKRGKGFEHAGSQEPPTP
jgi:hypothetical protein